MMRKLKTLWILAALLAVAFTSCKEDEPETPVLPSQAITDKDCGDTKTVGGGTAQFTIRFTASNSWTAEASEPEWCRVRTVSGATGASEVSLFIRTNDTGVSRTSHILVNVSGYADPVTLCTITQQAAEGAGTYVSVNQWVEEYMRDNYLWNEAIENVILDNSLDYKAFLTSILTGVAAQDDINHDDGHWENGARQSFYTRISGPEGSSNGALRVGTYRDLGVMKARYVSLTVGSDQIDALQVLLVSPGSAADRAGLRRGHVITKLNGQPVTASNQQTMLDAVLKGTSARIQTHRLVLDDDRNIGSLEPVGELTITATQYTDPAIYKRFVTEIGGRKVGYLLYMEFAADYDQQLLAAFDAFRNEGITDLVLDLRFNGGGDIRSCAVLGTLLAGAEYQGQVLTKLVYNARRVANGETSEFRIGSKKVWNGEYSTVEEALAHALALKTVYVLTSVDTASASEMLVNGLRGLGITVNQIGSRTNGKNVGMEGFVNQPIDNAYYSFYPVTFYAQNGKGECDFSAGLVPDVESDLDNLYPGDPGTAEDFLFELASEWIATGSQPTAPQTAGIRGLRSIQPTRSAPAMQARAKDAFVCTASGQ